MPDTDLSLQRTDGIATISFRRPRQRNAFTSSMSTALGEALNSLADDDDCRVIVLRGEGSHFCSGWDFNELETLRGNGDDVLQRQFAANLEVLEALDGHPKVTLSLVEGSTMGFGFSLAARCDLVLASDSSRFALPEISLGIVPAIVMTDVQRSVPAKFALDWLLTGREIDASAALQAAFVSQVFSTADFERSAREIISRIAGYSPTVLLRTKALFRTLSRLDDGAAAGVAINAAIEALNSPAALEGIAALLQKRKPDWPE